MASLAGQVAAAVAVGLLGDEGGRHRVHPAMNKELAGDGIKSVAFCPGFVDTDMSEFVKGTIPAEEMLRTTDITEALRFLLRVSPSCVVPELVFERPGEAI